VTWFAGQTVLRTVRVSQVFQVFSYNWNRGVLDQETVVTWQGRSMEEHYDHIYSSGGYIDGIGINLQLPDPRSVVTVVISTYYLDKADCY
jgi:hypothetical protein